MRKAWRGALAALLSLLPVAATAQTAPGWSIGPDLYYYAYREPNLDFQWGPFGGVDASYTFKYGNWFVTADGDAALGYLDYKSDGTGTINGLWNYKGEFRLLVGGDIRYSGSLFFLPFTGFGYRILFEEGNGRTSSTGAIDYDRLSQYLYVPIGLSSSFVAGNWVLRPSAEYDAFVGGLQISYLSEAGANGNLYNHQSVGYGARASFMMETPMPWGRLAFGPFFRYWNLGMSKTAPIIVGNTVGVAFEPPNNTIEAGLSLRFLF
jgi:hypothetical protein